MAFLQRIQAAYSDYDAGTLAYEAGDYESALRLARSAEEIVPNEARFYELEGDVLMATQSYEAALASYDRSVENDPNSAPAYIRRASARRALGDHGGAQQDFATSYLLEPSEKVQRQMGSRLDDFDNDPFFHQHNLYDRGLRYHPGSSWPSRRD
jgi:tetratricopeptide (TPR) repeat protein